MAACYWTGRISTDFGTAANWDAAPGGPAASRPPGPEDTGQFLSGGVDCLLSGDVTIGGLVTGPGYRGTIDLAGHNLAGSPAAGFLLAHSGDFVLGSGVLRVDGGTLGWAGLGGVLDRGTSTVHLSGGSAIFARSGDRLNDLLITAEGDGATVLTIGPGTLGLANLNVSSSGSSSVILNTAEHAPRLVVEGDLALVPADSSVITVEQSGAAPEWEIGGDVRVEGGRAGQVGWRCGSGTLTATGGRTQRWDWSLVAGPLEQIVIDKRWGSLVLAGSLACQGWTHRLGAFDPGGREIVCHGDLAIEPGGQQAVIEPAHRLEALVLLARGHGQQAPADAALEPGGHALAVQAHNYGLSGVRAVTPDRWLADFEKVSLKDEVRPLILKENAVRLLRQWRDGA